MSDTRWPVGVCPECGQHAWATRDEVKEDWVECKNEECGHCSDIESFREAQEIAETDDG